MPIKHTFTSPKNDGSDATLVRPSDWNADHSGTAKVKIRKNSGANVGERERLNFIEGSNITLTITDDPANEEVDVTVNASGGVSKMLYLADETEVSVSGTSETERKTARMLYHANALQPTTIRVFAEMRVSSASTGTVRVYIGGSLRITLTTTNTNYELQTGSWSVSGLSQNFHDVSVRLLNSSAPTTFLRTFELYYE